MKRPLFPLVLAIAVVLAAPAQAFIGGGSIAQSMAFTAGEMSTPMQHAKMPEHVGCDMNMLRIGLAPKVQVLREQIEAAETLNVPAVKAELVSMLNQRIITSATRNGCTHDQAANLILYFHGPLETAAIDVSLPPSAGQ